MSVRALRKLAPGEKLPAVPRESFNTLIDLRQIQQQQRFPAAPPPVLPASSDPTVIWIRNDGDQDIPRLGVLGIDSPVFDPDEAPGNFLNRILLAGVIPSHGASDSDDHRGNFVIAQEPIAQGAFGRAIISGAALASIDVVDEGHRFAEVIDGDPTQLRTVASSTTQVLWKQSGSGSQFAIVRLGGGGSSQTYAKLVDNRTAGGLYRAFLWEFGSENALPAILVEEGDMGTIGTQEISVQNMHELGESTHLLLGDSPPLVVFPIFPTGIEDDDGFAVWATWAVRLTPTCTVVG